MKLQRTTLGKKLIHRSLICPIVQVISQQICLQLNCQLFFYLICQLAKILFCQAKRSRIPTCQSKALLALINNQIPPPACDVQGDSYLRKWPCSVAQLNCSYNDEAEKKAAKWLKQVQMEWAHQSKAGGRRKEEEERGERLYRGAYSVCVLAVCRKGVVQDSKCSTQLHKIHIQIDENGRGCTLLNTKDGVKKILQQRITYQTVVLSTDVPLRSSFNKF